MNQQFVPLKNDVVDSWLWHIESFSAYLQSTVQEEEDAALFFARKFARN
jgi:hypothetical protein